MRESHISEIDPSNNGAIVEVVRPSHSEILAYCALTIQYICSTVGRSIASISDLGEHIYLSALHLSKYGASVVYIGYGPPYRTTYSTYVLRICK